MAEPVKTNTNKRIAQLVLAFAASLAAAGSGVVQVDPAVDPNYEVFGPSKVEAGSLVLLKVQGVDVKWEVFPTVPIETYGDENAFLATAFTNAGDYLVVCAFHDRQGKVRIEKQLITVMKDSFNKPTPLPIEEPEPLVSIQPVPDSYPNTKYHDVASEVTRLCEKHNLEANVASELSKNFKEIASRIEDGKYSNSSDILRDTASLNKPYVKVGGFSAQLQLLVSGLRFKDEVQTFEDYQDLWVQISEGLSSYAFTRS